MVQSTRRTHQQVMPGQVWRFPLSDEQSSGFLRVVLNVQDLGLSKGSPLAFVGDCYLVQISNRSELGDRMFEASSVLLDGLFLAPDEPWATYGFQCVGKEVVSVESIEFPCWFSNVSVGDGRLRVVFCRGELQVDTPGLERDEVEMRWGGVALVRRYPKHLSSAVEPGPKMKERLRRSDIRYHPLRQEILDQIKIDISVPYVDLVRKKPDRLVAYQGAIAGSLP